MAISNYAELKTAISNWMARSDLNGDAADFVRLGEAGLNRELKPAETDATLTATPASRTIDISSLNMVEPVALFLTTSGDERMIPPLVDGSYPFTTSAGCPRAWSIDGDNLVFDRPADQAHTFRFRHKARFALSDAQPTNWLLTNHPDVYLAASIVWGGVFIEDDSKLTRWATILQSTIPAVRSELKRMKPAILMVDPALSAIGWHFHGRNLA